MILGHMQTHTLDKVADALHFHRSQICAPFLNQPLDSGDKVIVFGAFQNPAVVNQDTQCAHGVGASAESEQIDFVTLGKVLNDVAVAIQIVLMSALSRDSRADAIVIGAQTRVIKTCCLGTLSLGLLARASSGKSFCRSSSGRSQMPNAHITILAIALSMHNKLRTLNHRFPWRGWQIEYLRGKSPFW